MKSKVLLHSWKVYEYNEKYYLQYTHFIYLEEIRKNFDEIHLLSPSEKIKNLNNGMMLLNSNYVKVLKLPNSSNYVGSIKYFFHYLLKYISFKNYTAYYSRYPVPFGWMQLLKKKGKKIIHYVGDPIDVTTNNPNLSRFKKGLMLTLFKPENFLYTLASKKARVFTNGYDLADKIKIKGVNATPLISSTLIHSDYHLEKVKVIKDFSPKLLYVGYLRKTKGVETILKSFNILLQRYPNSSLSIVGIGEFEKKLKDIVKNDKINNVTFLGHIDKREELNHVLRNHDIFCFASYSEGSPRVVLEAMANGMAVVSTPVGSLPLTFENNKEILFADFDDAKDFYKKYEQLIQNQNLFNKIRANGFKISKEFGIEQFIMKIFNEK